MHYFALQIYFKFSQKFNNEYKIAGNILHKPLLTLTHVCGRNVHICVYSKSQMFVLDNCVKDFTLNLLQKLFFILSKMSFFFSVNLP